MGLQAEQGGSWTDLAYTAVNPSAQPDFLAFVDAQTSHTPSAGDAGRRLGASDTHCGGGQRVRPQQLRAAVGAAGARRGEWANGGYIVYFSCRKPVESVKLDREAWSWFCRKWDSRSQRPQLGDRSSQLPLVQLSPVDDDRLGFTTIYRRKTIMWRLFVHR